FEEASVTLCVKHTYGPPRGNTHQSRSNSVISPARNRGFRFQRVWTVVTSKEGMITVGLSRPPLARQDRWLLVSMAGWGMGHVGGGGQWRMPRLAVQGARLVETQIGLIGGHLHAIRTEELESIKDVRQVARWAGSGAIMNGPGEFWRSAGAKYNLVFGASQ